MSNSINPLEKFAGIARPDVMEEIDPNLLKAMKSAAGHDGSSKSREKSQEHLRSAIVGMRSPEAVKAANTIFEYLLTRKRRKEIGNPLAAPIPEIAAIRELPRSHEFVMGELITDSPPNTFDELLELSPPYGVINLWLKNVEAAPKKEEGKAKAEALRKQLLDATEQDVGRSVGSGLAEWFVENLPAESLLKALPVVDALFSSMDRGKRAVVVRKAIHRDRSGNFLLRCVQEAATNTDRISDFAEIIRMDSKTLEKVVELLPKALQGDDSGRLGEMVPLLFDSVIRSDGAKKRYETGRIISLFGTLLKIEAESPGLTVALDGLRELFEKLESLRSAEDVSGGAQWVVKRVGSLEKRESNETRMLTLEQANLIAAGIERLRENSGAVGVIEALALNLGLEQIGSPEDQVRFDPLIHEDTVGGILPGDRTSVIRPGWKLGESVILRATVD